MTMDLEEVHHFHIVSKDLESTILCQLAAAYPVLIDKISKERDKKPSKQPESLASLDEYRYHELPMTVQSRVNNASQGNSKHGYLELQELKRLLEWKMARGVFRPSLRGLIAENSRDIVRKTTAEAFSHFHDGALDNIDNVIGSLKVLCRLRGVGPATASLVLSIASPSTVPFFADELFTWFTLQDPQALKDFLGKKRLQGPVNDPKRMRVDKIVGIKYTEREYETLHGSVVSLQKRLKHGTETISATDIEKAAYVVLQCSEVVDLEVSEPSHQSSIRNKAPTIASQDEKHGDPDIESPLEQRSKLGTKSTAKTLPEVNEDDTNKRRRSRGNTTRDDDQADSTSSKRRKRTAC